jgi:hypothetical protein
LHARGRHERLRHSHCFTARIARGRIHAKVTVVEIFFPEP